MDLDSWITPEETPALAAEATALIDTRLAHLSEGERSAFWASIRKAYNTPYNHAQKRTEVVTIVRADLPLPVAAMAASLQAELHAA